MQPPTERRAVVVGIGELLWDAGPDGHHSGLKRVGMLS